MNFFQRQQEVRRASRRLVVLFAVAVLALVAVIDLAVYFLFGFFDQPFSRFAGLLALITVVVVAGILLASTFRVMNLRKGGGGQVAQALGAVFVPENTPDPRLRRLRTGMVTVVGHDGVAAVSEIELLRTVCALLHCPLPPLADPHPEQVTP